MFASLVGNELEEGLDYKHVFRYGLYSRDVNIVLKNILFYIYFLGEKHARL